MNKLRRTRKRFQFLVALAAFSFFGCASYQSRHSGQHEQATPDSQAIYFAELRKNRSIAADFAMARLPISKTFYDLTSVSGQKTYYDFMKDTITPKLRELSGQAGRRPNERALAEGLGIGVKLNEENYNYHINYPDSEQGGRSYGWTRGKVGDWSDKMYLQRIGAVMYEGNTEDQRAFYRTIIEMLGASKSSGLSALKEDTQRVANNFLAIYSAEQYRAFVGGSRWDDALLQVTLLAAFHGGQGRFTKFYLGKFTDDSFKQAPGVYRGSVRGDPKKADWTDYWQFSAQKDSKRSGINLTRRDFELMGKAITRFYTRGPGRAPDSMRAIENIVGRGQNIFKALSQHFADGDALVEQTEELAAAVPEFLLQVRADARAITDWLKNERR